MVWYGIILVWYDEMWSDMKSDIIWSWETEMMYDDTEKERSISLSLSFSLSISLSLSSTISLSISLSLSLWLFLSDFLSDFLSLSLFFSLSLSLSLSLCLLEWVGRGNARDLHTENSFGQYQTGARSSAISTRCVSTLTLVLSSIKFITIYILFDTVYYSLAFYTTCIFFLYSSLFLFSFLISFLFSFVTFSS